MPRYPHVVTPTGRVILNVPAAEVPALLDRVFAEAMAQSPDPCPLPTLTTGLDPRDHHLCSCQGNWWVRFTLRKKSAPAERVHRRLHTRCIVTARRRRDRLFAFFRSRGLLGGRLPMLQEGPGPRLIPGRP